MQVQEKLLHQCASVRCSVNVTFSWNEKAVRSENDSDAGTEWLWAVLYPLQELSDMTAEHSVDVNWEIDIYNSCFDQFMWFKYQ